MSYAIITVGGKQYRVQEGERLLVDRLQSDEGATFQPRVLLVGGNGATELAPSTTVTARVVGHVLGEKIRIGKYKKRTGYRRHTGYRSRLTQIEIESIGTAARKAAAPAKAEPAEKKARAPNQAVRNSRNSTTSISACTPISKSLLRINWACAHASSCKPRSRSVMPSMMRLA